jgi:putative oxidoreductase
MFQRLVSTGSYWMTLPLRLALGAVFIAHGSQKVFGAFGGRGLSAWLAGSAPMGLRPAWLWLSAAAFAELLGGIMVLLGLFTRVGAFLIVCVMVVAIKGVHWGSFFSPAGVEYPVSLLAIALALLISGGGAASVDRRLAGGGRGRRR